jgi:hypothetical protein
VLNKFWEGLGDSLARQLVGRLISFAAAFWLIGIIAWGASRGGWGRALASQSQVFRNVPLVLQVCVIVLIIFIVIGSATTMERATPLILAALEGRWVAAPAKMRMFLIRRLQKRAAEIKESASGDEEYLEFFADELDNEGVTAQVNPELTQAMERYGRARRKLRQFPEYPQLFAPTRLGNIMRAADARPLVKYGLDASLCWPVLWLLLDQSERDDISKARASLDSHAQAWGWALLILIWTPLAWWAAPLGIVSCAIIYYSMLSTGELYGQLLEASFDLYRDRLYSALRLPIPNDSFAEHDTARIAVAYLARGTYNSQRKIRYVSANAKAEPAQIELSWRVCSG